MNDTVSLEDKLNALFEPLAEELGLELVSVAFKGSAGHRRLQVMADRLEGSVTVEDCARLSREISATLDVEDSIPGAFELEVSSPGIERPLIKARDFARFAGRDVAIRFRDGEGARTVEGRLEGIDGHERVLVTVGTETLEVALSTIETARLTFQFGSQRRKR